MIHIPLHDQCNLTGEKEGLLHAVYQDWAILCAPEQKAYLDLVPRFAEQKELNPIQEIKNSYRSQLFLIEPLGQKVVFKLSRRERYIMQKHIISLLKDSEAFATLKRAHELREKGLKEIYHPFLAMERRRHGMIEETILLYDYVDGPNIENCQREDILRQVVDALQKCHALGCRHSDAVSKNFIIHEGRICVIDSRFKHNYLGRFGEYLDFLTLEEQIPVIGDYYEHNRLSVPFIAAKTYRAIKQSKGVRRFKQALRARRKRRFETHQENT